MTDGTDAPQQNLRVMTWNVHGSARPSREGLARSIHAEAPDVVMLQEVRVGQAHRLANRLGMHVLWVRKHFPLGPLVWWRAEGLAILSRHRITPAATWLLTPLEGSSTYRRRIAQRVDLHVGGRTVPLVNTHLASHATGQAAHPAGRSVRAEQATRLVTQLVADGGDALDPTAIIGGDLNAHEEHDVLGVFGAAGLQDCWTAAASTRGHPGGFTSPAQHPADRIDYVLAGPAWSVHRTSVPAPGVDDHDWCALSDHLPVVADLALQ